MSHKVYSLYIINKSGGLIFQQDFFDAPVKLKMNDCLVLASMFHGLNAIAAEISPVNGSTGIRVLEADTFKLYCFQSPTGTKFFVLVDPTATNVDSSLAKIYEVYADYVLKNPFYELEMPIRCELFNIRLAELLAK